MNSLTFQPVFVRSALVASSVLVLLLPGSAAMAQQSGRYEGAEHAGPAGYDVDAARNEGTNVRSDAEDERAVLSRAKALIRAARFTEAESELRKYTAQQPASDDAWYLLAYTLFRLGRPKDSLEVYQRAAALEPLTSDDLKIIALNYGLLGEREHAATLLERVLAANANDTDARYYLGRIRFEQNKFEEASAAFQGVLLRDPHNVKAQNNLGLVLEAQNDFNGAIAAYRRAVELDARSPRPSEQPLINLAVVLLQRNETAEALSLLQRASSANPSSAKARFELGKAYIRADRLFEAERELTEATRLDPQDVGAHYQLGLLYQRRGKPELARAALAMSEQLRRKRK